MTSVVREPSSHYLSRLPAYARQAAPAVLLGVLGLVGLQAWVVASGISPTIMASPTEIGSAFWTNRGLLFNHAGPTILHTVGGFLASLFVGVAAAALIVHVKLARWLLYPLAVVLQVTPKEAIAPLLILWMGTGDMPRLLLAFLIGFFPIFINALSGFQRVDEDMLRLVRVLGGSAWQTFYQIRLPAAAPHIFSGMKISITLAIIGVIVAELVAGRSGLGYLLLFSSGRLDMASSLAILTVLSIVGLLLYALVLLAERLVIYWTDT